MKKFRVVVEIAHKEWYVVEAESEELAKERALDLSEEGEAVETIGDMFIRDVRITEEIKDG